MIENEIARILIGFGLIGMVITVFLLAIYLVRRPLR